MISRKTLACAALAVSSLVVVPASAQYSGRGTYGTGNSGQNSATAQAAKQVQTAQAEVNKVQSDINRVRTKVRAQLQSKPEWASVSKEKAKAQVAMEAARKAALVALTKKPEYQAVVKQREDAQKVREAASNSATASTDEKTTSDSDLAKADQTFIQAGFKLKEMEKQFLADDAQYNDAKQKYDAANAKMEALDQQVTEALKDNPDYAQLTQSLEQAKAQLEQAKQQRAQAAQAERQQREQEARSRAQQQSGGSGGGRGR